MTFLGNYSFNYLTGLIEFKYQQRMENVLVKDFFKSNEKSSTGDVFKYQNLLKATTKNQNIFKSNSFLFEASRFFDQSPVLYFSFT